MSTIDLSPFEDLEGENKPLGLSPSKKLSGSIQNLLSNQKVEIKVDQAKMVKPPKTKKKDGKEIASKLFKFGMSDKSFFLSFQI